MARPYKPGLEYFSHDVDLSSDPKTELLEAKHGLTGYGVYLKLLERVYREGYYVSWGENETLIFSKRVNVDINVCSTIVNDCAEIGLFNQSMLEKYSILTSHGIQSRYLKGCVRRKKVDFCSEYLLIDVNDDNNNSSLVVNVYNNSSSGAIIVDAGTQRKEKKRKEKGRGKDEAPESAPPKNPLNEISRQVLQYLNETCGKSYPGSKTNLEHVNGRQREGATLEDFKLVIDLKLKEWGGNEVFERDGKATRASNYLRPGTLFSPKNFDNYLNEAKANPTQNLMTREELIEVLKTAVDQESEEAMESFLRADYREIWGIVDRTSPFLFKDRGAQFNVIWRNYKEQNNIN